MIIKIMASIPKIDHKLLILTTLLSMLTACSHHKTKLSPNLDAEIKSEIRSVFMGLTEAVKSLNIDRYFQFFDQGKFTSLNADGSVFHSLIDFEKTFREQTQFIERYETLEFEDVKVTVVNRTTAILVNEYHATVLLKTGDIVSASGAGTQVWSKVAGQWKLVHISSSAKN